MGVRGRGREAEEEEGTEAVGRLCGAIVSPDLQPDTCPALVSEGGGDAGSRHPLTLRTGLCIQTAALSSPEVGTAMLAVSYPAVAF